MWKLIDSFLNDIAKETGHDRDKLSFKVDLCTGGPTIQPNPSANKVKSSVIAGPSVALPSGWYDSIGSNHLEYTVLLATGSKSTPIPKTIYSFQHHPFTGCCRFAIQRWVRNAAGWDKKLQKRGLKFRKDVTKHHGCTTLFVSSGPSGSGRTGELYDEFEKLYHDGGRGMFCVAV